MNYNQATLLFGVVFLITTVWVCIDAALHRVTTDGNETYHLGNGAAAWARDCIVLWFAALPWYSIRRRQVFRARTLIRMSPAAFATAPASPRPGAARPYPAVRERPAAPVLDAPQKRAGGMVYECEDCQAQLAAGMTACPGCGQKFDVPVPDDMGAETNKLVEFVECVLRRPTVYVRSDSFDEVATYLDGYTEGILHYAPNDVKANCLEAFGLWLSETQAGLEKVPRSRPWFIKIRILYPDDTDALRVTAYLYGEFLKDPKRACRPGASGSIG